MPAAMRSRILARSMRSDSIAVTSDVCSTSATRLARPRHGPLSQPSGAPAAPRLCGLHANHHASPAVTNHRLDRAPRRAGRLQFREQPVATHSAVAKSVAYPGRRDATKASDLCRQINESSHGDNLFLRHRRHRNLRRRDLKKSRRRPSASTGKSLKGEGRLTLLGHRCDTSCKPAGGRDPSACLPSRQQEFWRRTISKASLAVPGRGEQRCQEADACGGAAYMASILLLPHSVEQSVLIRRGPNCQEETQK